MKLPVLRAKNREDRSLPIWERGLKRSYLCPHFPERCVAPYMGAWIETASTKSLRRELVSLPIWERGLKHNRSSALHSSTLSLPIWERGLKRPMNMENYTKKDVAPYMGAWIETT